MIERKMMAHYIDAAKPTAAEPKYERLGKDLEEYIVELGAQVDKKKNILGNSSVLISSYEVQGSVEPYYAEIGTPMFERLQEITDKRLVLDDLKTTVLDVHLWTAQLGTEFEAYREEAFIEVVSYGGDTTGYQFPYLHWFTFIGFFSSIGEGQLSTLISVRKKIREKKKLDKWEQEFYVQNKKKVDFKKKYTEEEVAELNRLNKLLDGG